MMRAAFRRSSRDRDDLRDEHVHVLDGSFDEHESKDALRVHCTVNSGTPPEKNPSTRSQHNKPKDGCGTCIC